MEKEKVNPTRHINWTDRLVRPLRVICYTQPQLDLFLRKHNIPARLVRRVTREMDIFGVTPDQPLLLLPLWYHSKDASKIVHYWETRGGKKLEIAERVVIGLEPLCPNDTDGDGDCHLCAHKMSCQWLVPEKKSHE